MTPGRHAHTLVAREAINQSPISTYPWPHGPAGRLPTAAAENVARYGIEQVDVRPCIFMPMSQDCIFCKIARHEIPARIVHEDDEFIAFHDINPAAPVHLLLIPRHHIASVAGLVPADDAWVGRMLRLAVQLAMENGCRPLPDGGFRLLTNTGVEGGQEIDHLHLHIMGGERPWSNRAAPAA